MFIDFLIEAAMHSSTLTIWPKTILPIVLVLLSSFAQADSPVLQIQTESETFVGKSQAHNSTHFWLMAADGKLKRLPLSAVQQFQPLSTPFQPVSSGQLRDELRQEFGHQFEVRGSTHYLVCAAPGQAESYAILLEQLYREFYVYLKARNFQIQSPEFPLVTIVFPTQKQFLEYAKQDGVAFAEGLVGYYHRETNRVALYDPSSTNEKTQPSMKNSGSLASPAKTVSQSLQETLFHEATHQVAYNVGLHSRIGPAPRWVIEGLAMVFEHPDSRSALQQGTSRQRINRERYLRFQNYQQNRRSTGSLEKFLKSDYAFSDGRLILDAYSEAWALTFFLVETRPSAYAQYLHLIASRDPLEAYTVTQRKADFQTAFGSDLERLEIEFLRFIERL